MNKEVKRESDESETKGNRSSRNEKMWSWELKKKKAKTRNMFVKKCHEIDFQFTEDGRRKCNFNT